MDPLLIDSIWTLSSDLSNEKNREELNILTQKLIGIYKAEGRLDRNPFYDTTLRTLSVPQQQLNDMLPGACILVTGGMGCVGTELIKQLSAFAPQKIIIVDKVLSASFLAHNPLMVIAEIADICDREHLSRIFGQYQPDYVFHVAAQRDPGYAELNKLETVQTNVMGTFNVIQCCEQTLSVKQCVFSSTGKSSRYYTQEIYAATKKICEFMFDSFSRLGRVTYSMARFTHILDNSLMNMSLLKRSFTGHVSIHAPGKYVTAQNVGEAAALLLNGLIFSEPGKANFICVRNLEWPVESLEVALYYLERNNSDGFISFSGNPAGYMEKFFRGQMDWQQPDELNLLINVYENKFRRVNPEGDLIISHIVPVEVNLLIECLNQLRFIDSELSAGEVLLSSLRSLVNSSLKWVDPTDTLNILNWGLQPQYLQQERISPESFEPLVSLLSESLQLSQDLAS